MLASMLRGFEYARARTPVHQLDPRAKLAYAVVCAAASLITLDPRLLALVFLTSVPFVVVGKVWRRWLLMLRGLLPLLLFIFMLNVVFGGGKEGLRSALGYTMRFLALASTFSVVFLTTTPEELALALVKLRLPYEISLAFVMAVRFLPTLARELQLIIDAQRSRGLELERGGLRQRMRNFIPILVPLIVHEIRRSYQVAEAMESRGFGRGRRTFYYETRFGKRDLLFLMLVLAFAAAYFWLALRGV